MGDGDGTGTKPDAGDARCSGTGTENLGSRSEALRRHRDVPGIRDGTDTTEATTGSISTRLNTTKTSN